MIQNQIVYTLLTRLILPLYFLKPINQNLLFGFTKIGFPVHIGVRRQRHFLLSYFFPSFFHFMRFFIGFVFCPIGEIQMLSSFVDVVLKPPRKRSYIGIPGIIYLIRMAVVAILLNEQFHFFGSIFNRK